MLTINEILKDHVTLDIECIDRLYLNGYIPSLQTSGQLVYFLRQRGFQIPSPTLLAQATKKYNSAVAAFAKKNKIPMLQFKSGVRKDDIAQAYRADFEQSEGVVFIGTAQEKTKSFKASKKQTGTKVSFDFSRQSVWVKQYFKEGRGLRSEVTFNNPKDFYVNKDISNLPFLQQLGRQINRRLFSGESIERISLPSVTDKGQRASGLRLGQPRVMALLAALTLFSPIPYGFTNHSLRSQVADLMEQTAGTYAANQMTYDLRRLRLKGLIYRLPHSYRYQLTSYGWKVALLLTQLNRRIFRPAFAALDVANPVPQSLAEAFEQLAVTIEALFIQATLEPSG